MQRKIADRTQGRWKEILPSLGVAAAMLTRKHAACPVCGGKDRFRFDDKGGRGTWFCAQQHGTESSNASGSAGNGFQLVMDMKACDFAGAATLIETVIGKDSAPMEQTPQIDPAHDQAEDKTLIG